MYGYISSPGSFFIFFSFLLIYCGLGAGFWGWGLDLSFLRLGFSVDGVWGL